jgi:hypothetical protein
LAATLIAAAALALPSTARAGVYDVYGCRLPDGTPIPADGWKPWVTGDGGLAFDGCSGRGGLDAGFRPGALLGAGSSAGWVFDAPADTTVNS